MSNLEFIGKLNLQPFISMRKEEDMRIEEIKRRMLKKKSTRMFIQEQKAEPELTYERDVQEDY